MERVDHLSAMGSNLNLAGFPFLSNAENYGRKTRLTRSIVRRKVGAAEKRFAFGSHPYIRRPAAGPAGRLHERHAEPVHVRTFFAVHLHVYKVFIEQLGGLRILEGLPGHDVTPVAGRIPNGDKDWFVLPSRPVERLFSPRIPIHRIVPMLQKIGRLLFSEPILRACNGRQDHEGKPEGRPGFPDDVPC